MSRRTGMEEASKRQPAAQPPDLGGVPEPNPLSDPLLSCRWMVLLLILLSSAMGLWRLVPDGNLVGWIVIGVGLAMQVTILLALPNRRVDALYLRGFENDSASFDARLLVEAALHPNFRLSGIRAPRRRMPLVLRPLLFGLFAMRYLSSRYMNLEAESDWLARLWRTLADVRVVVIDLRNVTQHVVTEIGLAVNCVGIGRMIFISDSASLDASMRVAAEAASIDAEIVRARTVLWRGRDVDEIERFQNDINAIEQSLPQAPAGIAWAAFERVRDHALSRKSLTTRNLVDGIQIAVGVAIVGFLNMKPDFVAAAFRMATVSLIVRVVLGTLFGLCFIPFLLAVLSMFRRRPFERAIRRKSRGVLFKSFGSTTRTVFIASLAFGLVSSLAFEALIATLRSKVADAMIIRARVDMRSLETELAMYRLDNGRYPRGLEQLIPRSTQSRTADPWGERYEYELVDDHPRIWSRGPDRISGTNDDVVQEN